MKQIFNVVLQTFVKAYLPPDLLDVVHPMVDATIELYNVIGKELLPTPSKPHYTFNLRDVASVIQVSLILTLTLARTRTLNPNPNPNPKP